MRTRINPNTDTFHAVIGLVAPMQSFSPAASLELIGLGFLHLDTCSGGYLYLLVLTDHFSKFVQVYPKTNKSVKTAADQLYNDFMLRYSLPEKIQRQIQG